jgi:acyl-ACP thioesterase
MRRGELVVWLWVIVEKKKRKRARVEPGCVIYMQTDGGRRRVLASE